MNAADFADAQIDILVVVLHTAAPGRALYLRNVDMSSRTESDPETLEEEQAVERKNGSRYKQTWWRGFFS